VAVTLTTTDVALAIAGGSLLASFLSVGSTMLYRRVAEARKEGKQTRSVEELEKDFNNHKTNCETCQGDLHNRVTACDVKLSEVNTRVTAMDSKVCLIRDTSTENQNLLHGILGRLDIWEKLADKWMKENGKS
jgi:hypothetical protein